MRIRSVRKPATAVFFVPIMVAGIFASLAFPPKAREIKLQFMVKDVKGQVVEGSIVIANNGDVPFGWEKLSASCSCVKLENNGEFVLAPGATRIISFSLDQAVARRVHPFLRFVSPNRSIGIFEIPNHVTDAGD